MCYRHICRVVMSVSVVICILCALCRWWVGFYIMLCACCELCVISVVIQCWWKRVVMNLLGTCCASKLVSLGWILCCFTLCECSY